MYVYICMYYVCMFIGMFLCTYAFNGMYSMYVLLYVHVCKGVCMHKCSYVVCCIQMVGQGEIYNWAPSLV